MGRNFLKKILTGIGPMKDFLISESMWSRSSFRGWMVAANFAALLRVFFTGVLGSEVGIIGTELRGEEARRALHTF